MADISKCTGVKDTGLECFKKVFCHRYTIKGDDLYQSYIETPFFEVKSDGINNEQYCKYFIPDPYQFKDVLKKD